MYELHDEEIQHFGTKGMKWGVRKAVTTAKSTGKKYMSAAAKHEAQTKQRRSDTAAAKKATYEAEKAMWARGGKNIKKAGRSYLDAASKHEDKTKQKRADKKEKKIVKKDDKWEKKMDKGGSHAAISRMSRSNNDLINRAIDNANIVADKKGSGMFDSDGKVNKKYETYTNQKIADAMNKGLSKDKNAISPSKRRRVQMVIEEVEGEILLKSSIKK